MLRDSALREQAPWQTLPGASAALVRLWRTREKFARIERSSNAHAKSDDRHPLSGNRIRLITWAP